MSLRPRSLAVEAAEPVGAYTLLRLRGDGGPAGEPGQLFMLRGETGAAYLPRPLSAAWADEREIAFLLDIRSPGLAALVESSTVRLLGPLGHGYRIAPAPALLVGGGIGAAALPWLRRRLGSRARTLLGFRGPAQAACAPLVDPEATVVLDPVPVTEPLARLLPFPGTVYACGPEAMLAAVAALCSEHDVPCQLAFEAPMACGFGACYGCAVRIDGTWKRLCVEGPVLEAERVLA